VSLPLGSRLKIRSMIHVAAEPLPLFWPMRTFIHHNPLHGLEHLPFHAAAARGAELFRARAFLSRTEYQRLLAHDAADPARLEHEVAEFVATRVPLPGIDLQAWLLRLLTDVPVAVMHPRRLADSTAVHAALHGQPVDPTGIDIEALSGYLKGRLLGDRPMYESVDAIYGSNIGSELDELVIKSCLDFFDEGQSSWGLPERETGFFTAWRNVARRNVRFFLRGLHINRILEQEDTPEGIIAHVLDRFEIPKDQWIDYFTRELAHLHGWTGFIRWRAGAKHYYWGQRFPADLVDFMAVRLTLALGILDERRQDRIAHTQSAIATAIDSHTQEIFLRHELHSGAVVPAMAQGVEQAIALGGESRLSRTFDEYIGCKRNDEAQHQARVLRDLVTRLDAGTALEALPAEALDSLLLSLAEFERQEGMLWLRAIESRSMQRLARGLNTVKPRPREKRPFVQALFCIDTRSERIRRHLEAVGDYQTFGIAGFFGVPVSFMELGKGSETHICPVLLTPRNLVTEISFTGSNPDATLGTLERVMHELKESVLTPFVTVEAIGLLFGLDMVGKTLAPQTYTRWRKHLHPERPVTRLLLEKLDREQAESIIRAVQRAMIVTAIKHRFGLARESITDDIIRELRESALGRQTGRTRLAKDLKLEEKQEREFIQSLRHDYRINPPYARLQLDRLGRIGFTLDEQVMYVGQALRAIGLTRDFSRFVLLVGHGSTSENNPFESALDCGACGGNHGLVSARVLAQMANRREVRRELRRQGILIPDDTRFVAALHNTTTDGIRVHDLELLPPSHLIYIDRLFSGLNAASRLCAQERAPTLERAPTTGLSVSAAQRRVQRNAMDWSQVRPEWGLSGNAWFVIGRRHLTQRLALDGRAFLHSYDYRVDPKQRLLETILTGPLVVAQWINMEHYFSTVDNERFGSGSKVYHNVAGRLGVMSGNLSDLRTGLPSQTVLKNGRPYHIPQRLITMIEAPLAHTQRAIDSVATVKTLIDNGWIRLMVADVNAKTLHILDEGEWRSEPLSETPHTGNSEEKPAS
jgi:uncharacterized protein YbcC (UPF0753/DUF2309 family)